MSTLLKVLIVDDAESDAKLVARQLQRSGATLRFERVDNADSMRAALAREQWDVVISDWSMPAFSAPAALAILRSTRSVAPFIIVSGAVGEEIAADAMRSGASDFVLKDNLARLQPAIEREIEQGRARAEMQRVREEDERFFSITRDLFCIFRSEGPLRRLNSAWTTVLGWTDRELESFRWIDLVHAEDRSSSLDAIGKIFKEEATHVAFENRYRCSDKSYRHVHWTAALHHPDGAIYAAGRDITDRKRAEDEASAQQMEARRALEDAGRQKDEFLAILSHELRTPLQPILGWANLLKNNWGSMEPESQRKALTTIERSAKALSRLIEDVLDVSRIVLGKVRITRRPVDLKPIADAALDAVRASAELAQVDLRMESEAGPTVVLADPGRIQQVVWNLLSNAIKFTPPGGNVGLKVGRLGDEAVITVTDTGHGISPDLLPRVFDRFRQGDSSSMRAQGGLGLGLSIVHHLVQLHGGRVIASSEGPGRGSAFSVWLPIVEQAPETAPTERDSPSEPATEGAAEAQALKGIRILLVEDEPDSRDLIQSILEGCGAQVCSCASASEALGSLAREVPEIIVSDIGMPVMDGYALIRQIRQLPDLRQRKIPAVALTAYARTEDRLQALSAGYQAHLAKPIQPDELTKTVSSLLRGR